MKTSRTARRVPLARRVLEAAVGILTAVLVASGCAAGATAQSAGSSTPQGGGDLTFLIDSLGPTWIPNNSAISSFQGTPATRSTRSGGPSRRSSWSSWRTCSPSW